MNQSVAVLSKSAPPVYAIIQQQLEAQRQQTEMMQAMLNNMQTIEERVTEAYGQISNLHKQITDENRLMPGEIDDLYQAVVDKSTELAKKNYSEEEDVFTKIVGKYRKCIWSKMKKRFGVSKYIHIRRIDFDEAMQFVRSFRPEEHLF